MRNSKSYRREGSKVKNLPAFICAGYSTKDDLFPKSPLLLLKIHLENPMKRWPNTATANISQFPHESQSQLYGLNI